MNNLFQENQTITVTKHGDDKTYTVGSSTAGNFQNVDVKLTKKQAEKLNKLTCSDGVTEAHIYLQLNRISRIKSF